jgi:hypothetical protein
MFPLPSPCNEAGPKSPLASRVAPTNPVPFCRGSKASKILQTGSLSEIDSITACCNCCGSIDMPSFYFRLLAMVVSGYLAFDGRPNVRALLVRKWIHS